MDLFRCGGDGVRMTLFAMAVEHEGAKYRSVTGSQSGLITVGYHGPSNILEIRHHRIQRALDKGFVAIVAGFQDPSFSREVGGIRYNSGRAYGRSGCGVLWNLLGCGWCSFSNRWYRVRS